MNRLLHIINFDSSHHWFLYYYIKKKASSQLQFNLQSADSASDYYDYYDGDYYYDSEYDPDYYYGDEYYYDDEYQPSRAIVGSSSKKIKTKAIKEEKEDKPVVGKQRKSKKGRKQSGRRTKTKSQGIIRRFYYSQ